MGNRNVRRSVNNFRILLPIGLDILPKVGITVNMAKLKSSVDGEIIA